MQKENLEKKERTANEEGKKRKRAKNAKRA